MAKNVIQIYYKKTFFPMDFAQNDKGDITKKFLRLPGFLFSKLNS